MRSKNQSSPQTPRWGPLPLVVGIIGHKDLPESESKEVESKIAAIFLELQTRYPSTPLALLTSLAEGTDRIAARAALKGKRRLMIVIPSTQENYEKSFLTESSKDEFAKLLFQSDQKYELIPLALTSAGGSDEKSDQNGIFEVNSGAFIARNCQILIAVWDGITTKRENSIAPIVRFKLKGVPDLYPTIRSPLDPVETGPVYHIVLPKNGSSERQRDSFIVRKLFPKSLGKYRKAEKACHRVYKRINDFNRDVLKLQPRLKDDYQKSKSYLIPAKMEQTLRAESISLLNDYSIADSMAIYFQRRVVKTYIVMFLLSFLAIFFYQIYGYVVPRGPAQVELYVGSLVLALVFYQIAKRGDYENKYLDYRALAEGLRVQFFWQIAGIRDSVANHYLHKQRSELDWIRNAIRVMSGFTDEGLKAEHSDTKQNKQKGMRLALNRWIHNQYLYYSKATVRDQNKLNWLKSWRKILLSLGGALALIKVVFHPRHHLFTAAMGLAPAIGAVLYAYIEKRAFSQQMKQYGRMANLFAAAQKQLQRLLNQRKYSEARFVIEELGKEALAENGDWVILHRERPIQMPKVR